MTNETIAGLKRVSWLPDRDALDNGTLIAGQEYYDVEFTGGSIANVTLTDVTVNGTTTSRTETIITAPGNYVVVSDDYVVTVNKTVPQITTITLPASPATSRSIIVKDGQGKATDFPITIDGNGKTIDGAATLVIDVNWESAEIIFNATEWNIIGAFKAPADGDVVGPASSADNAVARFAGATGKIIKNSGVTITDADVIVSPVLTGTAPFTVASTTEVANLHSATATALATSRTIGGVSFNGTANIVPQTIQIVDAAADTTTFPLLAGSATGSLQPLTSPSLSYNAATGELTATSYVGTFTGAASQVVVGNEAADTTCFPLFATAATGSLPPKSNAGLTFNSNTGALGATSFSGAGTGLTGTAASLTAGAAPISGVTGLGTGVATALAVNVGTAGAPVINGGALGTPASGVATNLTGTASGLTAGAVAVGGITGLGTGVGTFLATPTSANLAAAVTNETGSGALVFGTTPTLSDPVITGIPKMPIAVTTSQFDKTSSAALATVTGLSYTVGAGKTYKFRAWLPTTSGATGGVQAAVGGTSTATYFTCAGIAFSASSLAMQRTTVLGNAVASVAAIVNGILIEGEIVVNAGGTLVVQFAQNTSNGTPSSVLQGASFEVYEI
jgi:hypothetical protein